MSIVKPPSESEKEDFFRQIAKEEARKPLILSVIKPYSDKFIRSSDHLPKLQDDIFKPEHLNKNYSELLTLAEKYLQDEVTPAMVDRLEQVTREQSEAGFDLEQEGLLPLG